MSVQRSALNCEQSRPASCCSALPAAAYTAVESDAQDGCIFVSRIAPCFLHLPVLLQNSEALMLLLWQSVYQTASKDPKALVV